VPSSPPLLEPVPPVSQPPKPAPVPVSSPPSDAPQFASTLKAGITSVANGSNLLRIGVQHTAELAQAHGTSLDERLLTRRFAQFFQ
jgi:hypothetical protein